MKFLIAISIVALIGANAVYIPKHLEIIGEIDSKDLSDFSKVIGSEIVYQNANPGGVVERVVTFPEVICSYVRIKCVLEK